MLDGLSRIVCAIALAAALLARADAPSYVTFHFASTTAPPAVALPAPAPPAADRPGCPPPRRDAPRVTPELPEDITDVGASPSNAGWIAAWNDTHVFVSHDAGATFQQALDGPGRVVGASFDCFGRLVVLRGNQVGVREGARETWHDVSALRGDGEAGGVIGGGPDVVVIGRSAGDDAAARLATSADGGATWGYRDLGHPLESEGRVQGRERDDGSVEIAHSIANCMDDILDIATLRHGTLETASDSIPEAAPFAVDDDSIVAEDRWRPRAGGEWQQLDVPAAQIQIAGGAFIAIAAGETTYRFDRGKLRRLPVVVEGSPRAVDPAGRIWSVADGRLRVASPSRASTSGSAGGTDRR